MWRVPELQATATTQDMAGQKSGSIPLNPEPVADAYDLLDLGIVPGHVVQRAAATWCDRLTYERLWGVIGDVAAATSLPEW